MVGDSATVAAIHVQVFTCYVGRIGGAPRAIGTVPRRPGRGWATLRTVWTHVGKIAGQNMQKARDGKVYIWLA